MSSANPTPGARPAAGAVIDAAQLARFLDTLFENFGVDFRNYAYSSMRRRLGRCVDTEGVGSVDELCERMLADPAMVDRILPGLTVHVTAMFRDAGFYRVLREQVIPIWRTYPFLRLWVAGCSSGEEAYSLAILLAEENLYQRCRIYATDLNEGVLSRARAGVFPLSSMQAYTKAYYDAGGAGDFSDYYKAFEQSVVFDARLRENTLFAQHNLVGDTSFNEFHGVFCRNVMIYFNRELQARVHELFYESLVDFGYLALGRSEGLHGSPRENRYELVSASERIFRKVG